MTKERKMSRKQSAVVVNADLFKRVSLAKGKDEIRYYLNATYIEPHPHKGALIVATNGHMMLVGYDPNGVCDAPMIVKVMGPAFGASAERAHVSYEKRSAVKSPNTLVIDGDTVTYMRYGTVKVDARLIENLGAKYPDWRKVVNPSGKPFGSVLPQISAGYLNVMARAFETKSYKAMQIMASVEDGALYFRGDNRLAGDCELFGVVMHMRTNEPLRAMPDWMPKL